MSDKGPLSVREQLAGKRLVVLGGTGFLGKVWLSLLFDRFPEIGHIYLVVRPKAGMDSQERFWSEIATSEVWDPIRERVTGFEAFLKEKITAIPGDVGHDFAGVPPEVRDAIRGTIDAVVNVAGVVDFQPPLDYALKANAFGMQNLIALVRDLGEGTKFMHTSTCYVAGDRTGQVDEVHPLEHPFPKCGELAKEHWDPAREISECLDMVEHVKHRANDAFRQSDFLDTAKQNLIDKGEPARGSALQDELVKVKRSFVENRLRDDGTERAKFWGWHNTYTYTKSIGEQILCNSGLDFTIVRPAVIESAVAYPRIGWCEGINTSTPLIYLAMQSPTAFPCRPESVLDVVPVDYVSAGMLLALAELFDGSNETIYQLGTSDTSPLKVQRFIELAGLFKRRWYQETGKGNPLADLIQTRLEPVPTTVDAYYNRGPKRLGELATSAAGLVGKLGGPFAALTRPASKGLTTVGKQLNITSRILDQFVPFIATHNYRFSTANTFAAFARLSLEEQALVPWAPQDIDWRWYLVDVHCQGVMDNVAPQIEARMNKEMKPLRAHDTLVDLLEEVVERHDLAPAMLRAHDEGFARWSYKSLDELSSAAALRLRDAGVEPGDRVLISGENHPDWCLSWFGIVKAGATAVPLETGLTELQIKTISAKAEVKAAVLDEVSRAAYAQHLDCTLLDLHELADRGPALDPIVRPKPDDIASILFTSGTTGDPKGVMLSHRNFCELLASLGRIFPLRQSDRVLSVLPLHHTFEFTCGLMLPLSRGARIVYLDEINGERLTYGLKEGRITGMVGVPALWQLLERRIRGQVEERGELFSSGFDAALWLNRAIGKQTGLDMGRLFFGQVHDRLGGNIRFLISGAAALPKETQELFQGLGLHLAEGYGLTEAAPVLTVAQGRPGAKSGHVGKPIPGVKLEVRDPDKDGIGEVYARGPNVMQGYYGNQAATDEALTADGWLRTGDLGIIDHAGRLKIMGRAKEVVVTASGENIYLDDVENALGANHDYIKEYSLVGIEDPRGGERLGMLVVPDAEENGDLDRPTLHARARETIDAAIRRLPPFQKPAVIALVDADLPRTNTRKVKRKEVRAVLEKIAAASSKKIKVGGAVAGPVGRAVSAVAGVDPSSVTSNTRLAEDLGFDSLMYTELASGLASLGAGQPDPDDLAACETVADVIVLVKAPKPDVQAEEDPRDSAVHIPGVLAEPLKEGLGFLQRELYGTGLHTRVYGRAHIPQNRQTIVVSNHCSHLDMGLVKYALGPYGHKLVALAAKDYFFEGNRWVVAYFEQLTNLEPIDRKRGFRASLQQSIDCVRRGHVVLIFPEGTRRPDGSIDEFKPLVGRLALETNVDILPLHLAGTFEAMPKGAVLPRRRDVSVRIGPPVEMRLLKPKLEGLTPAQQARAVTRAAQLAVESLRDGEILDLERLPLEELLPDEVPRKKPVEVAFESLAARFDGGRVKKPVSWYFTMGDTRYTVAVSPESVAVQPGKPSGGRADCVVKTSEEMLRKIIQDGYVPEPPEFFSGVIKTNDIPMLIEFSRVFDLSEVNL